MHRQQRRRAGVDSSSYLPPPLCERSLRHVLVAGRVKVDATKVSTCKKPDVADADRSPRRQDVEIFLIEIARRGAKPI